MSATKLDQVAAVAKSWEAACRSLDNARIVSHLSDDAVVWYNFEKEVWHGRDAYRALLDKSARGFRNQKYKDMRMRLHPGGFVEQATIVGETDEGTVELPFLLVATVADGMITRIEEYFDTTPTKQT